MERIITIGKSEFRVAYRQELGSPPVIYGITAFSDIVLFEGAMPILFAKDVRIQLGEAAILTLDMVDSKTLEHALVETISKLPKSNCEISIL